MLTSGETGLSIILDDDSLAHMVALRNVPGPMSCKGTSRFSSGIPQTATAKRNPQPLRISRTPKNPYPRLPHAILGLRFYSPDLGRWLSKDPLEDHASVGARALHGELEAQMAFTSFVMFGIAADDTVGPEARVLAFWEALYWVEGIRVLKAGDPSFSLRWRDVATGRGLSRFPIRSSGWLNQYALCSDDPVNFVDPLGLQRHRPETMFPEALTDVRSRWNISRIDIAANTATTVGAGGVGVGAIQYGLTTAASALWTPAAGKVVGGLFAFADVFVIHQLMLAASSEGEINDMLYWHSIKRLRESGAVTQAQIEEFHWFFTPPPNPPCKTQ